jgi:S-adenosylmethionine:tRNA ribosyltransferase-isomerase
MNPKNLQIKDFSYELPESKIAKFPLSERDASKLLIYKQGIISEDVYKNIAEYIPSESLLIFNNTKVVHARILFQNVKQELIEIFCLEPADQQIGMEIAMSAKQKSRWKCLIGRMNKWKEKILQIQVDDFQLTAELTGREDGNYIVEFQWRPETKSFAEVLEHMGQMPIPPYLKRKSEELDEVRYQTVYAYEKGSVAAPTAGLHFTDAILQELKSKQIQCEFITLHVGAGTFKPVNSSDLGHHEMHAEWIHVNTEIIQKIIHQFQKPDSVVIAVGTTSIRTLESLYWMGVKAFKDVNSSLEGLEVKQWDPYELNIDISVSDSLNALLDWMKKNQLQNLICKTQIIIAPPYQLKMVNALVTNFHQPDSTLLLLVAAVVGPDWKRIYQYALDRDFRFLSYGDGSLLFCANQG